MPVCICQIVWWNMFRLQNPCRAGKHNKQTEILMTCVGFYFLANLVWISVNRLQPSRNWLSVKIDILEKNLNQITQGQELFLDWVSQQGFCQKLRSWLTWDWPVEAGKRWIWPISLLFYAQTAQSWGRTQGWCMPGQHIPNPNRQLFVETNLRSSKESSLPHATLVDLRDKVPCPSHTSSLERY